MVKIKYKQQAHFLVMDRQSITSSLERFVEELTYEHYLNSAGLKDELDVSSIYSKYDLFNIDAAKEGKACAMLAEGEERRRLEYLHAFMAVEYIESASRELTDSIATKEASSIISFEEQIYPFRRSAILMANEPEHSKRLAIYEATKPLIAELNMPMKQKLERSHALAKELGYVDYVHMCSHISKINFASLLEIARNILKGTDSTYKREFERIASSEIGMEVKAIRKPDILRLLRLQSFDKFFESRDMLSVLKSTACDIGFEIDIQSRIILDVEKREKKVPRAFCAPLKIPDRTILVINPQGCQEDYQALLHEFGHAIYYSYIDPALPFEFKFLGDSAVSEGYAFLFHYLTANRYWLEKHFELSNEVNDKFLRNTYFIKLYMLRRYSAKLLYEYELHSGSEKPEQLYAALMQETLKFEHSPDEYLRDTDSCFYSASYLKAWIFESQLKSVLEEKFGERWFDKNETGKFLRDLFKQGQKYLVEEVLQSLGFYGLDEDLLIEEIETALA